MKLAVRTREVFQNIGPTLGRFPLAFIYFLFSSGLIAFSIQVTSPPDWVEELTLTCYVGALAALVAQMVFERFYKTMKARLLLYGGAVLFSILFHFLIPASGFEGMANFVRSSLILFGLSIAFVWVPSIKSRIGFHSTLLAGMRAGFLAFLFVIVLLIGVSLLLGAVDQLLFDLPFETYLHVQNPIYSVIGPLLLAMWIPVYPGKWLEAQSKEKQAAANVEMEKAITPPKSVEWLVSYIIIPLIAVFTVILIAYLVLNIGGEFWTDNLLEPMLVSYTTLGILVYLLASTLNNAVSKLFIRWYPVVLVPLVVFQTVASFLRMRDIGLTHGRYFTLMAGIFTIVSGIVFILYRSQKNSWIGGLLLAFLAVSIIPPVDAFTVSRGYYVRQLESVLERNNMLQNGSIVPNEDIPEEDKRELVQAYQYLNRMEVLDRVEGINRQSGSNHDFVNLFGFHPDAQDVDDFGNIPDYRSANVAWTTDEMLFDVTGFDQVARFYFNGEPSNVLTGPMGFEKDGEAYILATETRDGRGMLLVRDSSQTVLAELDLGQAFEDILSKGDSVTTEITMEEATVTEETEAAVLEVMLLQISTYDETPDEYNGEVVIKVGIK